MSISHSFLKVLSDLLGTSSSQLHALFVFNFDHFYNHESKLGCSCMYVCVHRRLLDHGKPTRDYAVKDNGFFFPHQSPTDNTLLENSGALYLCWNFNWTSLMQATTATMISLEQVPCHVLNTLS